MHRRHAKERSIDGSMDLPSLCMRIAKANSPPDPVVDLASSELFATPHGAVFVGPNSGPSRRTTRNPTAGCPSTVKTPWISGLSVTFCAKQPPPTTSADTHRTLRANAESPGTRSTVRRVLSECQARRRCESLTNDRDRRSRATLCRGGSRNEARGRASRLMSPSARSTSLGVADISAPDNATAPSRWAAFAGDYFDPYVLGDVSIRFDGNALYASAPAENLDDAPLTQVSGNEFSATLDGKTGDLTFYPDSNGATAWLVTRKGVARHEVALP